MYAVHSVWVHACSDPIMCSKYVLCVLLQTPTTSGSYNLSAPLLRWSLSLEGWYGIDVPFRDEHSTVSYSLKVVWLWVSVLITINSKRMLWWALRVGLIYGYKWKNSWDSLILCSFSRIMVLGSLLSLSPNQWQVLVIPIFTSSFWVGIQCKHFVLSLWWWGSNLGYPCYVVMLPLSCTLQTLVISYKFQVIILWLPPSILVAFLSPSSIFIFLHFLLCTYTVLALLDSFRYKYAVVSTGKDL